MNLPNDDANPYDQKHTVRIPGLPGPQAPGQARQEERHQHRGEQVDGVVVHDGLPADPPGGGRLVAHHLPDAGVEACGRRGHWLGERGFNPATGRRALTDPSTACERPAGSPAWSPAAPPRRRTEPRATAGRPAAGRPPPGAASQSRPRPLWPRPGSWPPVRPESRLR